MVVHIEGTGYPMGTTITCEGLNLTNTVTDFTISQEAGECVMATIGISLPAFAITANGFLYLKDVEAMPLEYLTQVRQLIDEEVIKREGQS